MRDTIVAPATPVGRSALAIVRVDGPAAAAVIEALAGVVPEPRVATLVRLELPVPGSRLPDAAGVTVNRQPSTGEPLDDAIAILYRSPASFTGNDLLELTLHGNPLLVERVIGAVVALGARIAEPGEFTERAVLNGKLDLVQAESIADLINARTPLQAKLSLSNLEGVLSRTAAAIREGLLFVISRLEAALDFADEGYEFITRDDARARIEQAIRDTRALAETYRRGRATTAGLSLVIAGRPNAGKSTLLNRLVGSERAIVTPVPGTTRDIVRETIEIGGLPVTLHDTAGLRESTDLVEGIGIERARKAARSADILLYLVDATVGLDADELSEFPDALVVYSKTDLAPAPEGALTTAELLPHLDRLVRERFAAPEGSPTLVNERQRAAVTECESALNVALTSSIDGLDEQMILVDLYRASNALGLLTGAITREDVFQEIFTKFCIGK